MDILIDAEQEGALAIAIWLAEGNDYDTFAIAAAGSEGDKYRQQAEALQQTLTMLGYTVVRRD